jgi:hypothetical protein
MVRVIGRKEDEWGHIRSGASGELHSMMIICRLETLELQHSLNGLNNIQFSYYIYVPWQK